MTAPLPVKNGNLSLERTAGWTSTKTANVRGFESTWQRAINIPPSPQESYVAAAAIPVGDRPRTAKQVRPAKCPTGAVPVAARPTVASRESESLS